MNRLNRILALALSFILCVCCCAASLAEESPAVRLEGDGFASPEEAVTYYLEGLKNLDFEQMLRAFAWETQAEHFSVETKLRRLQSYAPTYSPRFPGDSAFIRTANKYSIFAAQAEMIYRAVEAYLLQDGETPAPVNAIPFNDDAELDEFMAKFGGDRLEQLAGLSNIRFLTPDQLTEGKFSMKQNQNSYLKMNAMYGADETVDQPAVADLRDGFIFCCPTVARYGEKWYLVSVSSMTCLILGMETARQAFAYGSGDFTGLIP